MSQLMESSSLGAIMALPLPPLRDERATALVTETVNRFRRDARDLIDAGWRRLLIDARSLVVVDNRGCGALVSIANQLTRLGGALVIVGISDEMLVHFRSLHLDHVLHLRTQAQWIMRGWDL